MDYEEKIGEVEVPKHTGLDGFLHAIKEILRLPNIQKIEINKFGKVTYRHFTPKGENSSAEPLKMNFETLAPYAVIRNGKVVELKHPSINAAVAVAQLFSMATQDKMHPTFFVGSPDSKVWSWYEETTAIRTGDRESLFGLPFLADRMFEDEVLVLCAGFVRDGALIDTQKSYKLCIPKIPQVPDVG